MMNGGKRSKTWRGASRLVLALLWMAGGCSGAGLQEVDGGGVAPDQGSPGLEALVRQVAAPHVDPKAALADMSKTVGMVVVVVSATGSGVYGFGATAAGGTTTPGASTVFQIGSLSKALTGLVLARLETTGVLSRTARVDTLLPALAGSNGTRGVTLGMLVSHYAGLPLMPDNHPQQDPLSPAKGYSFAELKGFLTSLPAPVKAGVSYAYSNVGLGLLGVALNAHQGVQSNHGLLQKLLLKDLGIDGMWGNVAALPAAARARLAQGHAVAAKNTRKIGKLSEMGIMAGAGEVCASGRAMATLLELATGLKGGPLATAATRWIQPIKPAQGGDQIAYAVEVQPGTGGAGATYKKSGSTVGGYTAYLAFRRQPAVGVAVLTNVAQFPAVKTVAFTLLDKLAAR